MGVDLSRQQNENPDWLSCVGDTNKFERGYIGHYRLIGEIGKTQRSTAEFDEAGNVKSVKYFEPGDNYYIEYSIFKVDNETLEVGFFLEFDRKHR